MGQKVARGGLGWEVGRLRKKGQNVSRAMFELRETFKSVS